MYKTPLFSGTMHLEFRLKGVARAECLGFGGKS